MMNSISIGEIGEMKVLIKLKELGYQVFRDTNVVSRIDFLVRCYGDKYIKLQVKTLLRHKKSEKWRLPLKRGVQKLSYTRNEVDFFIGVNASSFYVISHEVAYRNNPERKIFQVPHSSLEAWSLLPMPYRVEDAVGVPGTVQQVMWLDAK